MMHYFLHTSALLAGFFVFYWLFIRQETFFKLNRWVLLSSIALSVSIPFLSIPEQWSLRVNPLESITEYESLSPAPTTNQTRPANSTIAPTPTTSEAILTSPSPASEAAEPGFLQSISWSKVVWYLYLLGTGVFCLAFLVQLVLLLTKRSVYSSVKDGPYRIVELVKDEAPYSFFNSIFINPTKYDPNTYEQIIEHEKIHIQQKHFMDKLIAELLVIAFWFNPFAWFFRSAITNNLEYLTDSSMLAKGVEKQTYQLSLLKVSVPKVPLNLAMNYNHSFLKNRISMMNTKKSSAQASWKYLFLLPLLGLSIVTFNKVHSSHLTPKESWTHPTPETAIQTSAAVDTGIVPTPIISPEMEVEIANTVEQQMELASETITQQVELATASVDIQEIVHTAIQNVSTEINELHLTDGWPKIKPGEWKADIEGQQVHLLLNNSKPNSKNTWITSGHFNKSELSSLPTGNAADFTIKRAAGTLFLNGSFSGDKGNGSFKFEHNSSFLTYLKNEGMAIKEEREMLHLFLNDMNKEYISYLKTNGFDVNGKDLVQLSIHGINRDKAIGFVQVFKDLNYKDYAVKDLVQFQIHNVEPDYVNEIRAMGISDLSARQVVNARIHNVEPAFIKSVKDYGFKDIGIDEIIQFSIHNIDVEYIQSLKQLGFRDLGHREIVQAGIHNVNPSYIKSIHDAGFPDMEMQELIQFSIHNISPDFIKEFKKAGFNDMSHQEVIQAGIHNVDVEFIKEVKSFGFDDIDFQSIIQMSIHNVDRRYLNEMKKLGFRNLSSQEIIQASIHNVRPAFIKELHKEGFQDMEMQEIIQFAIHNIDASYIRAFKEAGFKDLSTQDIVQAGIHNLSPRFISEMSALGFKEEALNTLVEAQIHHVTPSYIKKARKKGHNLDNLREYIQLKIRGL